VRPVVEQHRYDVFSVNDHLVMPPDAFTSRMPAAFRDRAPKVVEGAGADGRAFLALKQLATEDLEAVGIQGVAEALDAPKGDAWVFDGKTFPTSTSSILRSWKGIDFRHIGSFRYADLEPRFYDAKARLADLDQDGVLVSACLPLVDFPSYAGQYFVMGPDKELAHAAVVAYNDFVLDEWCAAAPDRYLPVIVIPMWDQQASAAEIRRVGALGARAITFPDDPAKLGLPSIHDRAWDPVFRAAVEEGMPLITHVGSSTWLPPMAPQITMAAGFAIAGALTPIAFFDWVFSDVFERHPDLQVVLAEGNAGWLPWGLWRADYVWERHSGWGGRKNPRPPSETFATNLWGTMFPFEDTAPAAIEKLGPERFLVETDYPHPDMSYPDTAAMLAQTFSGLDDEALDRILRSNARALFRFEGPSRLGR
jgi:predicted TIM-barrel fold metal-dependent hydrolase